CHPDYAEDIEGDLLERFERRLEKEGSKKAWWGFTKDVVKLFRPGIIRSMLGSNRSNHYHMFQSHFKIAWRNLIKQKLYSIINITGLAVGIASFLLIALYIYNELSYDRYHQKADNIYRVVEDLRTDNELLFQAFSSLPMGPAFAREYPDVLDFVRFRYRTSLVSNGNVKAYEENCYLADSSVFQVFNFPLIEGDPRSALTEPMSVVLTESTAQKYFGKESPVGKNLEINGEYHKVTGVAADVPANSHFTFDVLISFITFSSKNRQLEEAAWFLNGVHTYLLLVDGDNTAAKLRANMSGFITKYMGAKEDAFKMYYDDLPLQPLTNIYLEKPRTYENGKRGSISNLYILSSIALFILLIACFNYINLTTAQASRRTKEVSLRKVLGVERKVLIHQFLGESIIICFLSMLLGLLLTVVLMPFSNDLLGTTLNLSLLNHWYIWLSLLGFSILLGILAGIYPAFVLSGLHPLLIFRHSSRSIHSNADLRKVLVAGQFVLSITLIAGTLLVFDQLNLISNLKLGFDKEKMLKIDFNSNDNIKQHLESVKNELRNIPGVASSAAANTVPGEYPTNLFSSIEIEEGKMVETNINTNFIDHDFIPNYGIKMVAGRAFSRDFTADDSTAFVINESAVKHFDWTSPEIAIGRAVSQRGKNGRIVGVVQDFHYNSLHHEVEPLLMHIDTDATRSLSLKLVSDDIPTVVAEIEKTWKVLAPHLPFQYSFLDQDYNYLYRAEEQLSKVVSVFSGLAIFVACLGLLGLTSFSVERRFKEIGIRKVLGASTSSVVLLISNEFIKLILIALILAIPITYSVISSWLENFTQRIVINPFAFVIAGGGIVLVAWLVISFISIKAAQLNPVDALKDE
ncbi:MAG: ABC transporter permease, partial [Bacteroidota bacterium]